MSAQRPLVPGLSNAYADRLNPASDTLDARIEVSADGVVLARVSVGNGPHEEVSIADFFQLMSTLINDRIDDAAATTAGETVYWVAAGNDAIPEGVLKKVL
jgi:hypothetical protein